MSWTEEDIAHLRIKKQDQTFTRGGLSARSVEPDPRVFHSEPIPTTDPDDVPLVLRLPRRLESPNVWNGRHWRTKHRISQEWAVEIDWAIVALQARDHGARCARATSWLNEWAKGRKIDMPVPRKMRVTVERHVPSGRNFIRDDDNLRFCVKPLLDALKRQGYIKNDSRKWLEHPTPTQHVSEDGKDWTVITIEPVS
jgi:Holliday junction resolvase RusA-like endonuclease